MVDHREAELLYPVREQRPPHRCDLRQVLVAVVSRRPLEQRYPAVPQRVNVDAALEQTHLRRPSGLDHGVVRPLRLDELLQAAVVKLLLREEEVVQPLGIKVADAHLGRRGVVLLLADVIGDDCGA